MVDIKITAEIVGLEEDVEKELNKVRKQIPHALQIVGNEMQMDLQSTLHRVWYEGYKPKYYKRRTDNPDLGTPIGSDDNFFIDIMRSQGGGILDFEFLPDTGRASVPSDDLIRFIQSGREYSNTTVPPRPFWNTFLREQSQGKFIENFIRAMGRNDLVADENDRNVDFSEFMLDQNPSEYD